MTADETGPLLSNAEAEQFCRFIAKHCGVALSKERKSILSARLYRRVCALGLGSFAEYYKYLVKSGGSSRELLLLTDVVTTHKTDFFREPQHFGYLRSAVVPGLKHKKHLAVWSAGCSTGQEPYTIAMTLDDCHASRGGEYSILASDISRRVLHVAKQAVYRKEELAPLPPGFAGRYVMPGKGEASHLCRIVPELRKRVTFEQINLASGDSAPPARMDVIFCRNVLIYFNNADARALVDMFCGTLNPGGYLFIGIAESLRHNGTEKLEPVAPSVYRKK